MIRKVTKKWTMKNGQKIRICDMADSHLLNTIAFCERNHREMQRLAPFPDFGGEMAQMYAERDWDRLQESGPEETHPLYLELHAEAERRGLKTLGETT